MSEGQMMLVLVGIALQLIVTVVGGLGLAFKIWRWIGGLAERLAAVEANVTNLQADRGGERGKLRRQVP